jgi:hypothetical protein
MKYDCISSILEVHGKIIGYDMTSISKGFLEAVCVLITTEQHDALNENVSLKIDDEIMKIKVSYI